MSQYVRVIYKLLLITVLITCTHRVAAQVVVSEIAWMGTTADANDEWIELHNRGTDAVDLTGWTLSDGDALFITLEGTLDSGAFALLERTDDDSVTGVAAFQTYTGALSNAGRTLQLKDASGTAIDTVVGGENWAAIGGSNEDKHTPQRTTGGGWVTEAPTPGTLTVSSSVASDTEETPDTPTSHASRRVSGGPVVYRVAPPPPSTPERLTLAIEGPAVAYVNQPVNFMVSAHGSGKTIRDSLAYVWNFGDMFVSTEKDPTHAFTYPGEYVVVVDGQYAKQAAQARHEITVLPVSFSLTRGTGGDLLLTNQSSREADIGGFTLQGAASFVFPTHTILKAGRVLRIPSERIGTPSPVVLFDTAHARIAILTDQVPRRIAPLPEPVIPPLPSPSSSSTPEEAEPDIPTGVIYIGASPEAMVEEAALASFFRKLGDFFGL